MLTFLDKITGLMAPHECIGCGTEGALLCKSCRQLLPTLPARCYGCAKADSQWRTCASCRKRSPLWSVATLTAYEAVAEVLVQRLKFERSFAAGSLLGTIMAFEFAQTLPGDALVVPVPTSRSRVRQRGYDQAVLIARALARQSGLPYAEALRRYGNQRQTNSTRRERLRQLEGAFGVNADKLGSAKSVLLVDDVLTTGATLETAARELKKAGARHVHAVVFARAT